MTLNTKVRLPSIERFDASALAVEVMEDPLTAAFELVALRKVARLASELCTAVDNAAEDPTAEERFKTIFAELGPACDAVEGR